MASRHQWSIEIGKLILDSNSDSYLTDNGKVKMSDDDSTCYELNGSDRQQSVLAFLCYCDDTKRIRNSGFVKCTSACNRWNNNCFQYV